VHVPSLQQVTNIPWLYRRCLADCSVAATSPPGCAEVMAHLLADK